MRVRITLLVTALAVTLCTASSVRSENLHLPIIGGLGQGLGLGNGNGNGRGHSFGNPSASFTNVGAGPAINARAQVPVQLPTSSIPVTMPFAPTGTIAASTLNTLSLQFSTLNDRLNKNNPGPHQSNSFSARFDQVSAPASKLFTQLPISSSTPHLPSSLIGSSQSAVLYTPSGHQLLVNRGADVLVTEDGGKMRITNLTGLGNSVRLATTDGNGKAASSISLDPGTELVTGKDNLNMADLQPADGVARRNGKISGTIGISEIDLPSMLNRNRSIAKLITNPSSKDERKLGERILKMTAALEHVRNKHGFQFNQPAFAETQTVVSGQILPAMAPSGTNQSEPNSIVPATAVTLGATTPAPVVAYPVVGIDQTPTGAANLSRKVQPPTNVFRTVGNAQAKGPHSRQHRQAETTSAGAGRRAKAAAVKPGADLSPLPATSSGKRHIALLSTAVADKELLPRSVIETVAKQVQQEISNHPNVALAVMLLFLLMLSVMTMLAGTASRRYRELARVNLMLNTQIDERIKADQEVNRLNRGLRAKLVELNELNEQLTKAKDKAVEASRLKSEFVANISHEIRTPITAVLGMIGLLKDTGIDSKQSELVQMLDDSARSLLTVINDILDFSKIEAGMLLIQSVDFSVRNVVKETLDVLASSAQQKGLDLIVGIDKDVPAVVRGDPFRLRQVLLNLVGNAVKFTSEGSVTLLVKAEDQEPNQQVGFYVIDTGIGILEEGRSRLFQPFSQADGATTRVFGGTGLGLSISKRLIDLMGGNIDFRSESGKGSEFWFVLPFDTAQSEPQAAPATPAQLSSRNRGPVGPCKILVAEDSPVLQRIVLHQLQSLDYAVVLAANGLEAIEAMKHHSFDLVLMDWQMPQMDGIQATHMIRSMDNGANVPIIAMTANAMEGDRLSCLNAGMNDYISKPFTVDQLQQTVQGWLPEDSVTSTQQS